MRLLFPFSFQIVLRDAHGKKNLMHFADNDGTSKCGHGHAQLPSSSRLKEGVSVCVDQTCKHNVVTRTARFLSGGIIARWFPLPPPHTVSIFFIPRFRTNSGPTNPVAGARKRFSFLFVCRWMLIGRFETVGAIQTAVPDSCRRRHTKYKWPPYSEK